MRRGFTTGSAATAATKAALLRLLTAATPNSVEIFLPDGSALKIPVESCTDCAADQAQAAVRKDSGGDYDVTHGELICAKVRLVETPGITIKGGHGVGVITKAGLSVAVGESAINPVPCSMITNEASLLLPKGAGAEITISVPRGEQLAKKTLNARLGIVGGISIIGTTGIVEPKSLAAYKKTLILQLNVIAATGTKYVTLLLGYVGERYFNKAFGLKDEECHGGLKMIKIGDHVGFMLEECAKRGFEKVLLAGHIGKLVKLVNGQFNTHVNCGDERIGTIVKYAKRAGASQEVIREIEDQTMAEAVIDIIKRNDKMKIFDEIADDAVAKIDELVGGRLGVHCVILSLDAKVIGQNRMEDSRI